MLALLLACIPVPVAAAQEAPAIVAPPPAEAPIAEALTLAARKNQRVLLVWGGEWCGWCQKLDALFREDAKIARKLQYEYRVVHVQAGDTDANDALASRYGADLGQGYPYLTVLDAAGKAIANQDTGSLEEGTRHDAAKVLAFLERHQAPYQDAGQLFDAALARARLEHKRVFLAFEAPW